VRILANVFAFLLDRIKGSGLGVRHSRLYQVNYLSSREQYWRGNSIFLENIQNKIANDVAQMRFKHVRITRKKDQPDTMEWFEMSDIAQCLTVSPNDIEPPFVFWSNVVRKMIRDQIAVVAPVYRGGVLESLTLCDGVVEIEGGKATIVIGDTEKTVDVSNVFIFENAKQNVSAQLGQITKLIDDNLRALSVKLNEENSKLKGFLKIPTKAADTELQKAAEARVTAIMAAANSAGIGYLQQGEEFQELKNVYGTASEAEMEFLKSMLYQAFGINEALFTCSYTETQFRAYFQGVLKPYQRIIGEELNRKLFTKTARTQGHRLIVYFDVFDVVSLKDLSDFAFKSKYSALLSANEIREIMGYGAYEGGDVYESNMNAVRIGRSGGDEE